MKFINVMIFQLFKGKFYHCDNDADVKTRQECLGKSDGKWINRPYNFDNLAQVRLFNSEDCLNTVFPCESLRIFLSRRWSRYSSSPQEMGG